MAEAAIGFADHAREIGLGNALADEGTDHVDRDFGVRLAGETRDRVAVERAARIPGTYSPPSRARPASITSTKPSGGGLAPGRDVTH